MWFGRSLKAHSNSLQDRGVMELGEKPYDLDELVMLILAAQSHVAAGPLQDHIIDKLYHKVALVLSGVAEELWDATLFTQKEIVAILLALEQWSQSLS
jgi:hypothetical protein